MSGSIDVAIFDAHVACSPASRWRAPRQGTLRPERLLVVWAVVVTVFFSFSSSKLPFYILPALPAFVWLMAIASPGRRPKIASEALTATIIVGVAVMAAATQLDAIPKLREYGEGLTAYPPYMFGAGGLCVAGGAIVAALSRRVAVTTRMSVIAAINVAALQILLTGAYVLDAYFSAERAVDTFVGEKRGSLLRHRFSTRECWTRASCSISVGP